MRARREGRVLRLTLDRPDKRNALDSAACAELLAAIEPAEADREVGAVLIDAEGPYFCAGMDLDESLLADAAERNAVHKALFTVGLRMHKPIVAAVQGGALAGGVGLVAAAHVVLAADGATFSLPEIRIGMWPFVIWRPLAVAIGERRAVELSLTGREFTAAEALEWGLIHRIVSADELAEAALNTATGIAGRSPEAVQRGLAMVHSSRAMSVEEAAGHGDRLRARMYSSPDFAEGVRAFKQKRAPRWPSLEER